MLTPSAYGFAFSVLLACSSLIGGCGSNAEHSNGAYANPVSDNIVNQSTMLDAPDGIALSESAEGEKLTDAAIVESKAAPVSPARRKVTQYEVFVLPTQSLSFGEAYAINDGGQIAGASATTDNNGNVKYIATIWERGEKQAGRQIEVPPGFESSVATAIRDNGKVAGYLVGGVSATPFVWTAKDGLRILAKLPGQRDAYATAVNNDGLVGGRSEEFSLDLAERVNDFATPMLINLLGKGV